MKSKLVDELRTAFDDGYVPPRSDFRARLRSTLLAEQRISRGPRARRLAASLAVGIGTALVVALAIAVPTIIRVSTQPGTPRPSTGGGVIPWTDASAGPLPSPAPTPAPPSPSAGVAVCRSSDLRARAGLGGGGLGHYGVEFVFTDHGPAPCVLRGFPASVRFLDASGHVLTGYHVALEDGGYITSYPNDGVELRPGVPDGAPLDQAVAGQAILQLQTLSTLCGHTYVSAVLVTLNDGGRFRFETGINTDQYGDCTSPNQYPPMMSSFQLPGYPPIPTTLPTDLRVSISVRTPVRIGGTLDYTVTLINVSGHTLKFNPCPGYTESIKGVVLARYRLNCAAVPTLTPGQSRTFAMELPVPAAASTTAGTYPLSWLIDGPFVEVEVPGPTNVDVTR